MESFTLSRQVLCTGSISLHVFGKIGDWQHNLKLALLAVAVVYTAQELTP